MGPRQLGSQETTDGDRGQRSHLVTDPELPVGGTDCERQA